MRELTRQDVHDILLGCTVLGTGGGGSLEAGLALADRAFGAGKTFRMAALNEIPDDEWIGVPYMCGALTAEGGENPLQRLKPLEESAPLLAFQAMEAYIGKRFYGVMSTELGGGNTAESLYAAAMLNRVIVDADPAGRAVPELQHSTFYLFDMPIDPLAVADAYGDTVIISRCVDDRRAEDLVRALAVASNNSVGVVDHPATASDMRGKVIDGAISGALKIGRTLRIARESGKDAADAIAAAAGGKVLFRGVVQAFEWESKEGFTFGTTTIQNGADQYRIWFKNENIISWLNGVIHVTVPDLICILDGDAKPVQNPFVSEGMSVTVLALPAPEVWTGKRGLEVFGPRHFGCDVEYRPII